MMFKKKVADAAREIADTLQIVEQVKELKAIQKEMAATIEALGQDVRDLRHEMKMMGIENKLDIVKETHAILHAAAGDLNSRIERVTSDVAVMRSDFGKRQIDLSPNTKLLPDQDGN